MTCSCPICGSANNPVLMKTFSLLVLNKSPRDMGVFGERVCGEQDCGPVPVNEVSSTPSMLVWSPAQEYIKEIAVDQGLVVPEGHLTSAFA